MTLSRRSRRFERSQREGETVPRIVLTEDDVAILKCVYQNRLIDSQAIYRLFPQRSEQQLSRRLNAMFRNHFLGRPPKQLELFPPGAGSNHLIYGLDREGARLLKERFGRNISPYHWLQKNREMTRANIAHTVATTDFMTRLEASVRVSGIARIVHLDELLDDYAPAATRKRPIPERWQVEIDWHGYRGREGTRPDRIFAIEYLSLPKGKNRSFFYLELDQGSETIEPTLNQRQLASFFRKSSILRKFVIYAFSHLTRAHERHFGFPVSVRVLFVTPSTKRITAMQQTFAKNFLARPLVVPPGLFLFRQADKHEHGDLFRSAWVTAIQKSVHIDDRH